VLAVGRDVDPRRVLAGLQGRHVPQRAVAQDVEVALVGEAASAVDLLRRVEVDVTLLTREGLVDRLAFLTALSARVRIRRDDFDTAAADPARRAGVGVADRPSTDRDSLEGFSRRRPPAEGDAGA